jgi:phytoene dehydrogenase-like protein
MSNWDAIVIGAGLGGLGAAAAAAGAGRRVLVLERLANIGGAATNYRREHLTVEASLHDISGNVFRQPAGVLQRLGVASAVRPIPTTEFYEVRSRLFEPLVVPHGVDDASNAIRRAFPAAEAGISRFARALKRLRDSGRVYTSDLTSPSGSTLPDKILSAFRRPRLTVSEAMRGLFDGQEGPKLALCAPLGRLDEDPDHLAFLPYAELMLDHLDGGSIFLKGGARGLTGPLSEAITRTGGELRVQRTATHILLDPGGRACGVRHNGPTGEQEDFAPIIFGNAAPAVLGTLLPGDHQARFEARYAHFQPSMSLFTVALGLDRPARDFGLRAYSTYICPDWLTRLSDFAVSGDVFGGDPGAAMPLYNVVDYSHLFPQHSFVDDLYQLSISGADRLWAWEGFDDQQDHERRERWIDAFILDLDKRFPGIKTAIRHREMATARTMRNRLGTPHGEVYGFKPTTERIFGCKPGAGTSVPGLFLASAYTAAGGYVGALEGGLAAANAAGLAKKSPALARP